MTEVQPRFSPGRYLKDVMQTTNLLAVRMPNGRLFHASYRDEREKARIEAWAQANNARVDPAAEQPTAQALIHLA